jgi:WhiB family redox-sensing transcriptional regulator
MTTGTPARPARSARRSPWTTLTADEPPGRWTWQAACVTAEPELFFPAVADQADEAKRICDCCPVKPECLDYSLATAQEWGVWGGLTEQERKPLLGRNHRTRPGRPS